MQPIFGQGAYLLEHPDAKDRDLEMFVAGLQSQLKVDQAYVKNDAKAKRAYLDALVAARDKDELSAWVDEQLKACRL